MLVKDEIHERLTAAFAPRELVVVDDSESHRGHAGYQEGGQSHFNVRMRTQAFGRMDRIARHRAVIAVLSLAGKPSHKLFQLGAFQRWTAFPKAIESDLPYPYSTCPSSPISGERSVANITFTSGVRKARGTSSKYSPGVPL